MSPLTRLPRPLPGSVVLDRLREARREADDTSTGLDGLVRACRLLGAVLRGAATTWLLAGGLALALGIGVALGRRDVALGLAPLLLLPPLVLLWHRRQLLRLWGDRASVEEFGSRLVRDVLTGQQAVDDASRGFERARWYAKPVHLLRLARACRHLEFPATLERWSRPFLGVLVPPSVLCVVLSVLLPPLAGLAAVGALARAVL